MRYTHIHIREMRRLADSDLDSNHLNLLEFSPLLRLMILCKQIHIWCIHQRTCCHWPFHKSKENEQKEYLENENTPVAADSPVCEHLCQLCECEQNSCALLPCSCAACGFSFPIHAPQHPTPGGVSSRLLLMSPHQLQVQSNSTKYTRER